MYAHAVVAVVDAPKAHESAALVVCAHSSLAHRRCVTIAVLLFPHSRATNLTRDTMSFAQKALQALQAAGNDTSAYAIR